MGGAIRKTVIVLLTLAGLGLLIVGMVSYAQGVPRDISTDNLLMIGMNENARFHQKLPEIESTDGRTHPPARNSNTAASRRL